MKEPRSTSELAPSFFIGRTGKDIISFGSGQPDMVPPEELFDFKVKDVYAYGPVQGDKELRELIGEKEKVSPENVVVTNGVSEGLDLSLYALLSRGDEVKLVRPYYYSYPKLAHAHRGTVVFDESAKVLLLNSPSNPSGKVYTKREVESLRNNVEYIISDEIYRDLIYDGEFYSPRGNDVLTVNGFSKTYSLCGVRVGYVCSENAELIQKIVERKSYQSMNTSRISQEIAKRCFDLPDSFKRKVKESFQKRRDYIYTSLKKMGLEVERPNGAFYIFPKWDDEVVLPLFNEKSVITYPGRWFGLSSHTRLSYCTSMDEIKRGMERISEFLNK